jgi:hypothetical protein
VRRWIHSHMQASSAKVQALLAPAALPDVTPRPQHATKDMSPTETNSAAGDKGVVLDASIIMNGEFGSSSHMRVVEHTLVQ